MTINYANKKNKATKKFYSGCLISFYLLDIGYTHYVSKYACCSNARSSTVSLNEHWVFLIAFGGEQYYVVASFEVVEGMAFVDLA